jgi:hypothetical protein
MAAHFERACCQRLGYLLDRLGHAELANPLHERFFGKGSVPWVVLEPERRKAAKSESKPVERNERWRVAVQRYPEVDE